MWIIDRISKKRGSRKAKICFIGPSEAGKTTLVRYLETGKPVLEEIHTTVGISLRKKAIKMGPWEINIIDTGGQKVYQQVYWELAVQQSDAVVFIIDATIKPDTDPEKFEMVKEQVNYALDIVTEEQPLLFLLNKQDLKEKSPMNIEEAFKALKISIGKFENINAMEISAKYGDGVEEAMYWLVEAIEQVKG